MTQVQWIGDPSTHWILRDLNRLPSDSTKKHRSKQVQFGKTSWRSHGSYLLFGSILCVPKRRASKFQHHKKNNLWLETPLRKSSAMGPPTKPFFYFFFFRLVIGDFFLQGRVWCNSPGPIHPLGVVGWSTLLFRYLKFHHRFITSFSASNLSQVWRSITDTHRMPAFLWGIRIHVSQASAHLHNFQVWNASTLDPAGYFYRQSLSHFTSDLFPGFVLRSSIESSSDISTSFGVHRPGLNPRPKCITSTTIEIGQGIINITCGA